MITTAIGKPTPNALSVARANSESRFAWGRTSGNDMTLLLGAPASPRMNDEDRLQTKSWRLIAVLDSGRLWLTRGYPAGAHVAAMSSTLPSSAA